MYKLSSRQPVIEWSYSRRAHFIYSLGVVEETERGRDTDSPACGPQVTIFLSLLHNEQVGPNLLQLTGWKQKPANPFDRNCAMPPETGADTVSALALLTHLGAMMSEVLVQRTLTQGYFFNVCDLSATSLQRLEEF